MKVKLFYHDKYDCWSADFDGHIEPMPDQLKWEASNELVRELYIKTFENGFEDEIEIVR